jgi:hypothetical protein
MVSRIHGLRKMSRIRGWSLWLLSHRKMRQKRFVLLVLMLFTANALAFCGVEEYLSLHPVFINAGDEVRIEIKHSDHHGEPRLRIISPSQVEYYPKLVEQKTAGYLAVFADTQDKGFLKDNWNQYTVQLIRKDKGVVEGKHFYLKDKKTVFFTLYIDDVGKAGFPSKDDIQWYHEVAGPVNWGYECDDFGCFPLEKFIHEFDENGDFVFHHFHAHQFAGNKTILRIDTFLNWQERHNAINRFLSRLAQHTIHVRDRHIFVILMFLVGFSLWIDIKIKNRISRLVALICALSFILFLIASQAGVYAHSEKNLRIKIDDTEWCKSFLREAKENFLKAGQPYPVITRHGWNLPPANLNRFYIKEMNVLADASAIRDQYNDYFVRRNQAQRAIKWRESWEPYYANINGDLNTKWEFNEEDRGLLEIPLMMDNVSAYGFRDEDKQLIDELPNGALISTYLHPDDSIKSLKPIIDYITERFTVRFVSAQEYCEIYMSHFPRPMILDLDEGKSYWAYYEDGKLEKISESQQIDIFPMNNKLILNVKTYSPLPLFGLISRTLNRIVIDGKEMVGEKRVRNYFYLLGEFGNGSHIIEPKF